jgi:hypothetical protein
MYTTVATTRRYGRAKFLSFMAIIRALHVGSATSLFPLQANAVYAEGVAQNAIGFRMYRHE